MSLKNFKGAKVMQSLVSANPTETYYLSSEQFKFYEDHGYLVINQFIDFISLSSYKQRFLQICKGIVDKGNALVVKEKSLMGKNLKPEDYINKIQEILYDDVFIMYGENPKLLHVLSQLIGDDITAVNSMFINKPPGSGLHPPHQDLFYFPFRPAEKIIGTWTAIDHVNLDNGCLFVVPGSHKPKILYPHGDISKSDNNVTKLYHGILVGESVAPPENRVYLEMSPGDTVLLHPYLVHGSGPNISKHYRKAITFHFANSNCEYIDLKGTVQEQAAKDVEIEAKKMGFDISYSDIWRMKSKQVKGVRSNL